MSVTDWLVHEIRQVEDYLYRTILLTGLYTIFTRRTHIRYIQSDKVLQRVSSRPRWNVLLDVFSR